jgi:hypothetical protein
LAIFTQKSEKKQLITERERNESGKAARPRKEAAKAAKEKPLKVRGFIFNH